MRLRLTYTRDNRSAADLSVDIDGDAPVGALAAALAERDPDRGGQPGVQRPTLAVNVAGSMRELSANVPVGEAGLRSGSEVVIRPSPPQVTQAAVAVLTVHSGPDAGASFELQPGSTTVGRSNSSGVVLNDPMVSQLHARIVIGDAIEILDENSSNGILLAGQLVPRAQLQGGERVILGQSVVSITDRRSAAIGTAPQSTTVPVDRSPRVDPPYEGTKLVAPEPPQPPRPQRFPLIPSLTPLVLGVGLYAVTKNIASVIFVALSPMMLLGTWWENRRSSAKELQEAVALFRANLAELAVEAQAAAEVERAGRCTEHPGTAEVVAAIETRSPLLWARRPEHDRFMQLRLGLGVQRSRTEIEMSPARNSIPELHHELRSVVQGFELIDRVPLVATFDTCGSVGVSGPAGSAEQVARGLLVQLIGLHSPAELTVAAVVSSRDAAKWDWLKWLPHVGSEHSPLGGVPHMGASPPGCQSLVASLLDLVRDRSGQGELGVTDDAPTSRVVLVVDDEAPIERSLLIDLAEHGPAVGVHLFWVASSTVRIPAACRSYLEVAADRSGFRAGRVVEGELSSPVLAEPLELDEVRRLARVMAPMVDSGASADAALDLPGTVSFLTDAGVELASDPARIVDRWMESNSLPGRPGQQRSRRDNSLRGLVGRTAEGNLHLDLRTQGPHALVGGTTGSGKSEFLQSWIMGMASAHSPQRVTFLLVDYKGGSAFSECVLLPHTVGLVTDLTPRLVHRALTSLNAELQYRERILHRRKAKDLLELERRSEDEVPPPSLVIVVDEFAALVQEVPEFVDGVVNVAQRGRSLGLHLVLATQRPAGVIKDNLRANTNLRVALRMADDDDSVDVIGVSDAAAFAPDLPGRAIVKTGAGRLSTFQSAYVGGWTTDEPPAPTVVITPLEVDPTVAWEVPDVGGTVLEDLGPTDIQRLVRSIRSASETLSLPAPRRPWLQELAAVYELDRLRRFRDTDRLVFGVLDDPAAQAQVPVAFDPERDGNMAVIGTGGSGKSAFLRTVAVAAGYRERGPCFVYGLDFGAHGMAIVEDLPHVGAVVPAADTERVARLVRQLREAVDERAPRFAAVNAGSLSAYREIADPNEPRVLLLVDGMGALRTAYETGPDAWLLDTLQAIAVDGRPVGIHVVISADRPGAVPNALASSMQQTLVMRLTSETDLVTLGAPLDGFTVNSPPGRGYIDGQEVQVAVLGGSADQLVQSRAVVELSERLRAAGAVEAPPIRSLPTEVTLQELPATFDDRPVFAVADDTLGPSGFDPRGVFLVAGPAFSGKTTTVRTLVAALDRARPGSRFAYIGHRRSPLARLDLWSHRAITPEEASVLASELADALVTGTADASSLTVVIDGLPEFLNGAADFDLQELLKVCRAEGVFVIAEGETSGLQGSWPLLLAAKTSRHGVVLQPNQIDGETLFSQTFPRINRADFCEGRGMYVHAGKVRKVQVALDA
jgi:S-DNA-T family DNA segregation ATPase FtsK/SpoIIIE